MPIGEAGGEDGPADSVRLAVASAVSCPLTFHLTQGRRYLPYWKVRVILSTMETSEDRPTPDDARAIVHAADSARDELSHEMRLPSWFYTSIGLAIVVQTVTLAVGVAAQTPAGIGLAVAGLVPFGLVAWLQLARFRRLNGAWISGLASRVVFGGGAGASTLHFLALGIALWAAFEERWWLVGVCAIVGGAAYAISGALWVRSYRSDPAGNSRGESILLLGALIVLLLGAVLMLILQSTH
jgi:hypothetical protein